jgi:hypothetical protein
MADGSGAVEYRCWARPPEPAVAMWTNSQPPRPIVVAVMRPTWADYSCALWREMQPDHPDLHPVLGEVATHAEPEKVQ